MLEDLSANGTYVNAFRVGKDKSAKVGLEDVISMAKPTRAGGALKFKLQEAPARSLSSQQLVPPKRRPSALSPVQSAGASGAVAESAPRPPATPSHAHDGIAIKTSPSAWIP